MAMLSDAAAKFEERRSRCMSNGNGDVERRNR